MAKSGTITSPSGADANLRSLGDTTPKTDTLAGIVREALGLVAALKFVIINFLTGKAVIAPTGAAAPVLGSDIGYFTKDAPEKASSPWTFTPGAEPDADLTAALEAVVGARKPSMSVESLTNAVEDLHGVAGGVLETEDKGLLLHYDQADGVVKIRAAAVADVGGYDPAAAYPEDAAFVRTVAGAAGQQFGE